MIIAIHQPNFCPWLPYFYKMAACDKFIILGHVQFEKNGFQNRYNVGETWVTKPVQGGLVNIIDKFYTDGNNVFSHNLKWIKCIKETLDIHTPILYDFKTDKTGTERLIQLIKHYNGDTYLTNPDAKEKYLDEELMKKEGIKIEYLNVPSHLKIHTFTAFEKWGIEGTSKQLPRRTLENSRLAQRADSSPAVVH